MHLTKIRRIPHLRWDRPVREIEITEEMVEAGISIIVTQDGIAPLGFFFSPAELAEKVFLAMTASALMRQRRTGRNRASVP